MAEETNTPQPATPQPAAEQEAQSSFVAQQANSSQAYAAQPAPSPQPAQQPQAQPAPAAAAQPQSSAAPAAAAQPSPAAQPVYAQPTPVYVTNQTQPSKAPWIVLGVIVFLIVATFALGAMSCSAAVDSMMSSGSSSSVDDSAFATGDTVAVIDINSTIQYDGTACSPEGLSELLSEAEADDSIKAVVLRIDSGGGTATAGEEMTEYVKRFSKPVVVSSASMNCSAAYEISSAADVIYVNKSTAIGAIGTAMQLTDLSGLMEMLGISVDNIVSADSKDSSYGTRALTDEEREYYQQLVDTINETFIDNVAEGRNMTEDEVRALATGMEFTGTQAVENGLADKVGIFDDAIAEAASLGGIEGDYSVSYLTLSDSDISSLLGMLSSSESDSQVSEAVAKLTELLKSEGVLS